MASLSGGFTNQESAYDFSSSPLKDTSFAKDGPKLKSNKEKTVTDDRTYNLKSIKDTTGQFSLSQIPNENISFNNNKSQRFNSKEQVFKISNSQEVKIYDVSQIIRLFENNESLKRSLAVRAISQSKYSTNEVFDIVSWNNLNEARKTVISNDIYNLTISRKNINLQLVASYIIWSKTNG